MSHLDQKRIWDFYQNEGVSSFDQAAGRLSYLVRVLTAGSRVLNIGVGNGALEEFAYRKGVEIWSLDPSEQAIDRLKLKLPLGDRAVAGLSQAMPFPDEHFDAVVMSEVLEHLEPDVFSTTVIQVVRVLKPGGRLIATVPARENLLDSMVVCPACGTKFHRWGHTRSFTIERLVTLMGGRFIVEQATEHHFAEWETVGLTGKLKGLLKRFLSWRGIGTYGASRNILFIGRKPAVMPDQVANIAQHAVDQPG